MGALHSVGGSVKSRVETPEPKICDCDVSDFKRKEPYIKEKTRWCYWCHKCLAGRWFNLRG
jgi:hypothetical protein